MKKLVFVFLLTLPHVMLSHPGIGIVEDSKGNIYYTDLKQVWKIDVSGNKKVVVPNVHTHELFIDDDDTIFGEHLWYNGERLDTWGHYVWKFSSDEKFSKVIPDKEGFIENYSFVRDHFGRMYIADRTKKCQHITRRNLDNTTTHIGDACFENIRWMKWGQNDLLYVVDLTDLKAVDRQGHVKTVRSKLNDPKLFSFDDDRHAVYGVWDDKEGNIYTAILADRVVKRFAPDGTETVALKTSVPWSPTGGLVSSKGELWVLENSITNSVRVERINQSGERRVF